MDISWLKANPVKILVNGDWMLSPSRITSSRRRDPTVLGTAKPTHRKSISWRGRDESKRILMEFTIVSNEIQYIVIRNSKLAEKCIKMDKLAQEDHSYCPSSEEYERYRKNGFFSLNKSGRKCTHETPIRLPNSSHNYESSPPRIWRRTT